MKQTDNQADHATPPTSGAFDVNKGNATQLTQDEVAVIFLQSLDNFYLLADFETFRKGLTAFFNSYPHAARVVGNTFASWEAGQYLNNPEKMPTSAMLRMVGSFDKDQQRDLLKQGLEHATGQPITFTTTKK